MVLCMIRRVDGGKMFVRFWNALSRAGGSRWSFDTVTRSLCIMLLADLANMVPVYFILSHAQAAISWLKCQRLALAFELANFTVRSRALIRLLLYDSRVSIF